jgi:hypothetical protein
LAMTVDASCASAFAARDAKQIATKASFLSTDPPLWRDDARDRGAAHGSARSGASLTAPIIAVQRPSAGFDRFLPA